MMMGKVLFQVIWEIYLHGTCIITEVHLLQTSHDVEIANYCCIVNKTPPFAILAVGAEFQGLEDRRSHW